MAIAIIASAMVAGAAAAPPPDADPALHDWFESLKQPDTGYGCCANSDCRILADKDWRQTADGYEIAIAGEWHAVPAGKVLQHQSNPTGHAVACYRGYYSRRRNASFIHIFCFVRATES